MKTRILVLLVWLVVLFASAAGQTGGRACPGVTVLPIKPVTIQPGLSATLKIAFRVNSGYINSHTPVQEILIPTTVKLNLPSEMLVGKIEYPAEEQTAFPFMPEKLSVYSGTFSVTGVLRAMNAISPGTYRVRGELRYQPCSDGSTERGSTERGSTERGSTERGSTERWECFPPQSQEFAFDVIIRSRISTAHGLETQ
jgi:hypothetical protein